MFVDFSIFTGFLNRDFISKWLLRSAAAHSSSVYSSTHIYSDPDQSNLGVRNPHQPLVQIREGKDNRESYWSGWLSVIFFNICNNQVHTMRGFVLRRCLNTQPLARRSRDEASLSYFIENNVTLVAGGAFIKAYAHLLLLTLRRARK